MNIKIRLKLTQLTVFCVQQHMGHNVNGLIALAVIVGDNKVCVENY